MKHQRRSALVLCAGALLVLTAGCDNRNPNRGSRRSASQTTAPRWHRLLVDGAEPIPEQQLAMLVRGQQAISELSDKIIDKLEETIEQHGPAEAINACAEVAPLMAVEVEMKHRVRIGRTSGKLRNPVNAPPEWAVQSIEQQTDQAVAFVGPHGAVAVLSPIRLKERCLTCHGDPASIEPDVLSALNERYPEDAATGFAEGDLRGWFWAEVEPEG